MSNRSILSTAGVTAVALSLIPSIAAACPACALRDDGGIAAKLAMAAMIALPFGIAGVVVHVIRRVETEDAELSSAARSDGDSQT